MSKYNQIWNDVPSGYYADPATKARHDSRMRDERRFTRLVENELGKMGLDRHEDIPTENQIETAEGRARRKF